MSVSTLFQKVRSSSLGLTAAANLSILAASAAVAILSARLFEPVERGQLAGAIVWAAFACALGDFGMSQAAPFFAARKGRPPGRIVASILFATLLIGAGVAVIGMFAIAPWLSPPLRSALTVSIASVPASLALTSLINFCQGRGEFVVFNAFRMLRPVAHLIPLVLVAVGATQGVGGTLTAFVMCEWLLFAAACFAIAARFPLREWRGSRSTTFAMLGYGLKAYPGNLSWLANSRLDQVLLSLLLPLHVLGIYAVAASYAGVLFSLASSYGISAYSHLARAGRSESAAQVAILMRRMCRPLILGCAVLGAGAFVFVPLVFGPSFGSAALPAALLLPGAAILAYSYVVSVALRATGSPAKVSVAEGLGLAITLVGLLTLLPAGGIMAVVFVSLASYAAVAGALTFFLARHAGERPHEEHPALEAAA